MFQRILFAVVLVVSSPAFAQQLPGVHRLTGVDSTSPTEDLEPFAQAINGALVVGFGESVHTSRGYYQMKSRLIKYLVAEKNFRVIAMESPWLSTMPASKFVDRCEGTSLAATKSIFGVFQDIATQEMFEWLCQWNKSHPRDKVTFFGYDIQEVAQYSLVLDTLGAESLDPDGTLADGVRNCVGAKYQKIMDLYRSAEYKAIVGGQPIPADENNACLNSLDRIDFSHAPVPARAALHSARAFQKMLERYGHSDQHAYSERDEGMAKILIELHALAGNQTKVINWAHNAHLQKVDWNYGTPAIINKTMGVWLYAHYGEKYMPFALNGYQVLINWPWVTASYPEFPVRNDSLEAQLHQLNYQYAFVDLSKSWLTPGKDYYDRDGELQVPADLYLGIFYLDYSPGNIYAGQATIF